MGLVAVVAVLAVCWFSLRAPLSFPTASSHVQRDASTSTADAQDVAQAAEGRERADPGVRTTIAEEPPPRASADDALLPLRPLSGTLHFFDPYGAHRSVSHGSFRLHSNAEEEPRTVAVEQGAWAVDVPDDGFEVDAVVAEGSAAFLHSSGFGSFRFPADGTLALLVRRNHGCRLVVVDARTGRELSDVEVVREKNNARWGKMSPDGSASETHVAEHASSPIELTLERDAERYFVRAPGFAWCCTCVRRSACGDRVVALHPGGDLSVLLGGFGAPEGAELRVRRQRDTEDPYGSQYVDHLRAIGPLDRGFDFAAIEAGSYEISVEVGRNTWKSARVAALNCVVNQGERTRVELALPSAETALLVKASGTIRATGWPSVRSLTLYSRFAPRVGGRHDYSIPVSPLADPPESHVYEWNCSSIEPGAYSGFIDGPSCHIELTIDPVNRDDYVIVVPPLAHARVRVLDPERGEPAAVAGVGWIGYSGEWLPGGMINPARFEAKDAAWHFDAPAGSVSVWINDDDYEFRNVPFALAPGDNELELRVRRACGITVTFVCAGALVARDVHWKIELVNLDGSRAGFANPLDDAETELILKAPAPGKYRLSARGLDGYRIAFPLDVTVPSEGFARVVVELERAR